MANDTTLDIRSLGQSAGFAQGFEKQGMSMQQTMELRRKQRIERMMHIQKLSLGVEQLAQQERESRRKARLTLTQLNMLEHQNIRGHEQRQRLQQLKMEHEVDLQDRAEAAQLKIEGERQQHDRDMADIEMTFRSGESEKDRQLQREEGSADRANRYAIAKLRTAPAMLRAKSDIRKEQMAENEEIINSLRLWARQNVFDDGKGNFNRNALTEIFDQDDSILHPDEITNLWRKEWLETIKDLPQFRNSDVNIGELIGDKSFSMYLKSVVTGRKDQEEAFRRSLEIKREEQNKTRWDNSASRLHINIVDGQSITGVQYNGKDDRITFAGDEAKVARMEAFAKEISAGGNGPIERDAKFQNLMMDLQVPQTMWGQAAEELDLYFFKNEGAYSRFSQSDPDVFFSASQRLKGSLGQESGRVEDPFDQEVTSENRNVASLATSYGRLSDMHNRYTSARASADPSGSALMNVLAEIREQIVKNENDESMSDAVKASWKKMEKDANSDLVNALSKPPPAPEEPRERERKEIKSTHVAIRGAGIADADYPISQIRRMADGWVDDADRASELGNLINALEAAEVDTDIIDRAKRKKAALRG